MGRPSEDPEIQARRIAEQISVSLVVRSNNDGSPHWDASWRDSKRKSRLRRIGPAWLVSRPFPKNPFDDDATGRSLSDEPHQASWRDWWEAKPGRPRSGALDERRAYAGALELVVAREIEILREKEAQLLEERGGPVLFRQVAAEWIAAREREAEDGDLKPSSLKDYRSMLREPDAKPKNRGRKVKGGVNGAWIQTAFGERDVTSITADDFDKLERQMQAAKRSPRTRAKYRSVISMILDHARRENYVERNVLADAPRRRRRRRQHKGIETYTRKQVEEIATRVDDELIGDLILVLATTGLRLGEVLALRWMDVSFGQRSLSVKRTYNERSGVNSPKSGSVRTVPMAAQARDVLKRVRERAEWKNGSDLVFGRRAGNPRDGRPYEWTFLHPATVRRAYYKARDLVIADAESAGKEPIQRLRIHDLRHAFGSRMAASGVEIPKLQKWMGHASITTTMIYVHFQPQDDDADLMTRALEGGMHEKE